MNEIIILCAKYLLVASIILAAVCWYRLKGAAKKDFIILTLVSGLVAIILAKLSGHFIYDARPFVSDHIVPLIPHANDNGFPSDHALLTSWLGFAVLMVSKRLGVALLVIALIVGSARVAAGVHHPVDILGSFVISAVAVAATAATIKLIRGKRGNQSNQA